MFKANNKIIDKNFAEINLEKLSLSNENIYYSTVHQNNKTIEKYSIFLTFKTSDLDTLNKDEYQVVFNSLSKIFKLIPTHAKLYKFSTKNDLNKQKEWLQKIDVENNKTFIFLKQAYLKEIEAREKHQKKANSVYFLAVEENDLNKLQNYISSIKINNFQINVNLATKEEFMFYYQDSFYFFEENLVENARFIKNNSDYLKVVTTNNFPLEIEFSWLRKFLEIEDVSACVNINIINKAEALRRFNKAIIASHNIERNFQKYESDKVESRNYSNSFNLMIKEITSENDVALDVTIYCILRNKSKSELKNSLNLLKASGNNLAIKLFLLTYEQSKALRSCRLFNENELINTQGQEFTSKILASGVTLTISTLSDEKGLIIGVKNNYVFSLDIFKKNINRVNSNALILGKSGSGKSYLAKKLVCYLLFTKVKVFIIDPEREYNFLTRNFNGSTLDATEVNSKINPWQIYKGLTDSTEEAFEEHIKYLLSFFEILFPATFSDEIFSSQVSNFIQEFYFYFFKCDLHQINQCIDLEVSNEQWPTFNEALIFLKWKRSQMNISNNVLSFYEKFERILNNFTQNQRYHSFNLTTKINNVENSRLLTIDLYNLLRSDKTTVNLYLYQYIRFLNQQIAVNRIKNPDQKFVILIDEAHLLVNENNLSVLEFFYETSKRIRKYNGAIILISQDAKDFSGSAEVLKLYTGIINNCNYWFIGGQNAVDINDLIEIFKQSGGLNETVVEYISLASQGKFYLKASPVENYLVQVIKNEDESHLFEQAIF